MKCCEALLHLYYQTQADRQSGRGRWSAGAIGRAVVVTSSTFAVTAFRQAIAHELTRRYEPPFNIHPPAALGSSLVAPQNPRTIAAAYPLSALHCAPLHRSGTCAHNFCQRCKRAEQKLITLKSFIKKVYFLLAHGTGHQSLHRSLLSLSHSLLLCPKNGA